MYLHVYYCLKPSMSLTYFDLNTVECLIFMILLREFREAPWIHQNKTRQI